MCRQAHSVASGALLTCPKYPSGHIDSRHHHLQADCFLKYAYVSRRLDWKEEPVVIPHRYAGIRQGQQHLWPSDCPQVSQHLGLHPATLGRLQEKLVRGRLPVSDLEAGLHESPEDYSCSGQYDCFCHIGNKVQVRYTAYRYSMRTSTAPLQEGDPFEGLMLHTEIEPINIVYKKH